MDALEFSFKTFIYRAAEYDTMVPPFSTNLFLIYLWVRKAIVKRTLKQKARGDLVTWAACISQVRYKMYKTFISSLFCHAKSVTFKSKSKFQNCVIRRQERCSRGNVLLNTNISANSKDSEHEFNKWTYGRLNLSHISTASVMPPIKSTVRLFWGVKGQKKNSKYTSYIRRRDKPLIVKTFQSGESIQILLKIKRLETLRIRRTFSADNWASQFVDFFYVDFF